MVLNNSLHAPLTIEPFPFQIDFKNFPMNSLIDIIYVWEDIKLEKHGFAETNLNQEVCELK